MSRRQIRAQRRSVIDGKRMALTPLPPAEEDGDEYEPSDEGNSPDWRAAAPDALDDGQAAA